MAEDLLKNEEFYIVLQNMEVLGGKEKVDLPEFGLIDVPAKVDSGANRSAIHCSHITVTENNEVSFHIPLDSSHGEKVFHVKSFFKKNHIFFHFNCYFF